MKRLTTIGLLLVLAAVLTSCVSRYERDMALAAERTAQERYAAQAAQSQAQALQAQASAAAAEAQARADAQTAMAQANAQVRVVEAQEATKRETAWLSILPWLALITILCGGAVGAGWLVLWYRGRAHLVTAQAQAQAAMMLPPPWQWPALPPPTQRPALPARDEAPAAVARAAERVGGLYRPDPDTPGAWLIEAMDGSRRIRMLPAPRE